MKDLGVFDTPDDYYTKYSDNLAGMNFIKRFACRYIISKTLTRKAENFRQGEKS